MPNRAAEAKTSSRLHARFTVPFFSIHEHVPERAKRREHVRIRYKYASWLGTYLTYLWERCEPSDQCCDSSFSAIRTQPEIRR